MPQAGKVRAIISARTTAISRRERRSRANEILLRKIARRSLGRRDPKLRAVNTPVKTDRLGRTSTLLPLANERIASFYRERPGEANDLSRESQDAMMITVAEEERRILGPRLPKKAVGWPLHSPPRFMPCLRHFTKQPYPPSSHLGLVVLFSLRDEKSPREAAFAVNEPAKIRLSIQSLELPVHPKHPTSIYTVVEIAHSAPEYSTSLSILEKRKIL